MAKKSILLVDDNEDLLTITVDGLKTMSDKYDYYGARSAKECFQVLQGIKPAVIILDIMMPDVDGWETAAKLRNTPETSKIPIIMLTAKDDNISRKFGEMVVEKYITKPFDIVDLLKSIEEVQNLQRLNK